MTDALARLRQMAQDELEKNDPAAKLRRMAEEARKLPQQPLPQPRPAAPAAPPARPAAGVAPPAASPPADPAARLRALAAAAPDNGDRSVLQSVARGLGLSAHDVAIRLASGMGWLASRIPGDPLRAEKLMEQAARERAALPQSRGAVEKGARLAGNILGEGATTLAGGAGVGGAISKIAPASRAARAIAAGRTGTLGQRVAAQTVPFLPVDAALGLGADPANPLRGAAVNVALGAGGGAGIEAGLTAARGLRMPDFLRRGAPEPPPVAAAVPAPPPVTAAVPAPPPVAAAVPAPPPVAAAAPTGKQLAAEARFPSGKRRPVKKVSNEGLLDELGEMEEKRARAGLASQYRVVNEESTGAYISEGSILAATRHGKGPSEQAKALRNLEAFDRIEREVVDELKARGYGDEEEIFQAVEMRRSYKADLEAERVGKEVDESGVDDVDLSTGETFPPDTDFDFGANVPGGAATPTPPAAAAAGANAPSAGAAAPPTPPAAAAPPAGPMQPSPPVPPAAPPTPPPIQQKHIRFIDRLYHQVLDQNYLVRLYGRRAGATETVSQALDGISNSKTAGTDRLNVLMEREGDVFQGPNRQRVNEFVEAERRLEAADNNLKEYESPVQRAADEATVQRLQGDADVIAGASIVRREHRKMLDEKLAEGAIDQEMYDAMVATGMKYVPLVPEWATELGKGFIGVPFGAGGRLIAGGTGVRKFRSGGFGATPVADQLEQLGMDMIRHTELIAKQRVTNLVAGIAATDPAAAAPWLQRVSKSQADRLPNVIKANVEGQLQYFKVLDDDVYRSLTSQGPMTQGAILGVLRAAKNVLRVGVTYWPDFLVSNFTRDAMHVASQQFGRRIAAPAALGGTVGATVGAATADEGSRLEGAAKGFGFGISAGIFAPSLARTVRAMGHIIKKDDVYRDYLQNGGAGFEGFYTNRQSLRKVLTKHLGDRSWRDTVLMPVDGMTFLGYMVEQAPRLAAYKDALARGATPREAGSLAVDISVNFSNIGASRSVKQLSSSVAFFNAQLQGWDKMVRMLTKKETRKQYVPMAMALMTGPTIALWYVNNATPERTRAYLEQPVWERSLFWLIPRPEGGFYKVPKPFELGFIFATVPEMILNHVNKVDPEHTGRTIREFVMTQAEGLVPIPTLARPVVEHWANRSLFTQQQLREKDVAPEQQYTEQTPEAAVVAGEATGLSPKLIENYIRGTTGTAGSSVLQAISKIPERSRAPQVEPRMIFGQRFFTLRTTMPESERRMRERLGKAEQAKRTLDRAGRVPGDEARVARLEKRYAKELADAEQLEPIRRALGDVVKMRRELQHTRELTSEQKKQAAIRLNQEVVTLLNHPEEFQGFSDPFQGVAR